MKYYKKFYEVGNNRYYTIVADDEMYIATESFLNIGKKKLFRKQKELGMGLKLLKFSPPIAQLFLAVDALEPTKKQKYDSDDLVTYNHVKNKKLKENIIHSYRQVIDDALEDMKKQQADLLNENKIDLAVSCDKYIEDLEKINPMEGIEINDPYHVSGNIIKTMIREGLEHLYTEVVTAFSKNVYLYEQDEFGTLTIYRIFTVKNIVKTVDTFVYDKKLIENLLKTLYEEGR